MLLQFIRVKVEELATFFSDPHHFVNFFVFKKYQNYILERYFYNESKLKTWGSRTFAEVVGQLSVYIYASIT